LSSILKKIVFATILTVILLVLLNFVCAMGERLAYGAFWGDGRPQGLYIHKNGERPRLAPNAILPGFLYDIRINSLGFRGRDLALDKAKKQNHIRIWAIGGSTTFDIYARNNEETWPSLLETYLQKEHSHLKFEVINAGVPGEIYWGSIKDFEKHYRDIRPDFVILYHGPNDLRQVSSTPLQNPDAHNSNQIGPTESWIHLLLSNQEWALIRVLRRTLQPMQPVQPHWENRSVTPHMIKDLEGRVNQMLKAAQQRRVKPILATHALRAQVGDSGDVARIRVAESAQHLQLMPEQVISGFAAYNKMMKKIAQKRNLPLADIRSVINDDPKNWGDATHFRLKGSERTAQEFFSTISPLLQQRK
jgi:lysophospholipase L1-like esterase